MRLLRLTCALLLLASTPALAQNEPVAAPAPAPFPEAAEAEAQDPNADPNADRRRALFDLAFSALVDGNLGVAERAFAEASALPGDPAQSAVAASFVERAQALRARRREEADATRRTAPRPREQGRTEKIALLGTTTALGLGLYGWTFPQVLGIDPEESTRGFVGMYMLTAASSFVVPYLLLRNSQVTPGEANLAFYGGTRGIWHGVLLGSLVAGEIGPDRRERGWQAAMLFGSVAGLIGGYQLARVSDMTAGQARTIAAVADYGLMFGFGFGFLLRLDGGPDTCDPFISSAICAPQDRDGNARKMAAAGLVGTGLGMLGGHWLSRHRSNTWGDGEVLRGAILVGTWAATGLAALGNTEFSFENRTFTGLLMGGGTLGLLVGDLLVRRTDFTPGQSMLVDLSMVSGALLGAGGFYLLGTKDDDKVIAGSALGSIVGFGLSYWGFHDAPESRTTRRLSALSPRGVTLLPTVGTQGERGLALAGLF
jgi:hypothetical protein